MYSILTAGVVVLVGFGCEILDAGFITAVSALCLCGIVSAEQHQRIIRELFDGIHEVAPYFESPKFAAPKMHIGTEAIV